MSEARARLARAGLALWHHALVALGAGLGGAARVALSLWAAAALPAGMPWGTLIANGAGSLLIGFYAALTGPNGRLPAGLGQRLFVMTGFCGGFTTFSLFSLETLALLRAGDGRGAAALAALSLALWLGAAGLGYAAGAAFGRHAGAPLAGPALRLRIHLGRNAWKDGRPLHEALVFAARRHGLSGATVLHGTLGYGPAGKGAGPGEIRFSWSGPYVIEIVDMPRKIRAFLPTARALTPDAFVTLEPVRVIATADGG